MSLFTHPLFVALRSVTRRLGINRALAKLFLSGRYEDRFGPVLRAQIRSGDIVWDVGANVGLYTSEFLHTLGPSGCVVAFEPVPSCFERLREQFGSNRQVRLFNAALGSDDGEVPMLLESDPLSSTHRIGDSVEGAPSIRVPVRSGESVARDAPDLFPNILKIDVEGYEGSVIDGLASMLADPRLRCVGIEVHFDLLAQRQEAGRPKAIEAVLQAHGFNVHWTDPSHLIAVRGSPG